MTRHLWIVVLVLLGFASGCSLFESEGSGSSGGGDGESSAARIEAVAGAPRA